jgi:hypothetical protein
VKRISLTGWIFIGMAVGVAIGLAAPGVGREMRILATIFLRLIKSIVAPLLFGTLVYGIAGTGDLKAMGRIGLKAMIYFEVLTTTAGRRIDRRHAGRGQRIRYLRAASRRPSWPDFDSRTYVPGQHRRLDGPQ